MLLPGAELLIDDKIAGRRGQQMMAALSETLPEGSVVTKSYKGDHQLLVVYGIGNEVRTRITKHHRRIGGDYACWDLGYWHRDDALRLAINAYHPTAEQLAKAPPLEWRWPTPRFREDADPAGPVLLIGLGPKSCVLYGLRACEWEYAAVQRIKALRPGSPIVWRPKGRYATPFRGYPIEHGNPIEDALVGKSLVVCRHSNVAVDACIAGVPVICDDGAALSIYQTTSTPTLDQRREFVRRLGWWNWRPSEAAAAWQWIHEVLK